MCVHNNSDEQSGGQIYWIWPLSFSPGLGSRILHTADRCGQIAVWKLLTIAVLAGALPALLAIAVQLPFDRFITAIVILPLLLGATRRDSLTVGLGVMTLAIVAHCAVIITFAARDPDALFGMFPAGADYWERSHKWITTGESPEYSLAYWVPAHFQILAGSAAFAYTSHGFLTIWEGLYEVDLMNCYVGQLAAHSENVWLAVAVGWHPWSVLRGIGYLLVTFEVSSYSLQRMTATTLSTPHRRLTRWGIGLTFLVADGVVKFLCMEPLRQLLESNLIPPTG